jgi:Mrp family chromosome partitioning ATPase
MGRTFDTLSQGRAKRESQSGGLAASTDVALEEIAAVPDTPSIDTPVAEIEPLIVDNEDVPYFEVGGPRGTVTPPPSRPLVLPAPKPVTPIPEPTIPSVAFFPLREGFAHGTKDAKQVSRELVAFHKPEHPVSSQYRLLMNGIAAQNLNVESPLLIFTSVDAENDCAAVILNLAVTRAREEKKRVLVIEANHERPSIASRLGIAALPGLRELLNRSIPVSLGLHRTAQTNLFALPPGDPNVPVPGDAEARLPLLLKQFRQRFECILVNAPAWGHGTAEEWARLGDGLYIVVQQDHWDSIEVEAAQEGVIAAGGELRGYVTLRQ